jgi:hypothetical protein
MVQKGFDGVYEEIKKEGRARAEDSRLLNVKSGRLEMKTAQIETRIDTGLREINNRMLVIERDIAEIRSHFVYRVEFDDLSARVKYLEKKAGVKSGK